MTRAAKGWMSDREEATGMGSATEQWAGVVEDSAAW